jgi:hypothetical protein
MIFMKRLLMGFGAVALAGTLLSLVAPKAVHAAVAALVLVTNTSANPVPNADVNAPGEEPFQTQLCISTDPSNPCVLPGSFIVPTSTSDGLSIKRLVTEHISASCTESATVTNLLTAMNFPMNENQVNGSAFNGVIYLPLTPAPGTLGGRNPVASLAVRAYADPGALVGPSYQDFFSPSSGTIHCSYTVVGYYLTH